MIAEDAITLVKALIRKAGCDGIYYCVQNAETFRFTSEEYHKFVEPYDLKVLDYANSISKYTSLLRLERRQKQKYGKIIEQRR